MLEQERRVMARTNIVIDDELIAQAMELTGARSKREAVDIALRRLVQKGSLYRALRKARGRIRWDGDVDAWRRSRS
jgi:Arc/MetJ family transcription regulator